MTTFNLFQGDCLEKLKELPDNSIDSIVTDPPYGLSKQPDMMEVLRHWLSGDDYVHKGKGFMGKEWDSFVPGPAIWKECLRVLKPGGHMVAFFGTRTYDLGVLDIRIAGFEIRDQLAWVFGSGFPKSRDISKDMGKKAGAQREVIGRHRGSGMTKANVAQGAQMRNVTEWNTYSSNPASEEGKQWQGWGTALKPAFEPIVLARKPLDGGNIAENVLKYGTGGINIDGCRVPNIDESKSRLHEKSQKSDYSETGSVSFTSKAGSFVGGDPKGRFPANFIHDGSEEVTELFPYTKSGKITADQQKNGGFAGKNAGIIYGSAERGGTGSFEANEGSAARFFYCAKASSKDRDEGLEDFELQKASGLPLRKSGVESTGEGLDGTKTFRETKRKNIHPTTKPTELMQYLCRLITPPNGTILDPFMGSGSTGKAAMYEGFNFIGIELMEDHMTIAKARIAYAKKDAYEISIGAKKPKKMQEPKEPETDISQFFE